MERLTDFFVDLSARERILIFVLLFLVLPAAIYFALLVPLERGRDQARVELVEASALLQWTEARASEARRLQLVARDAAPEPIGASGVEQSLAEAGLRKDLTELSRNDQDLELQFEVVEFTALGSWINSTSLSWGYDVTSFKVERVNEPGLVRASLTLTPQS